MVFPYALKANLQILNLHEHEIVFSYVYKDKNLYRIKGWYHEKKGEYFNFDIQDDIYVCLWCEECGFLYKSKETLNLLTTKNRHELIFYNPEEKNLFTESGQQIQTNTNDYYSIDYAKLVKEYDEETIYVGTEKEQKDYFHSELVKCKESYNKQLSDNIYLENEKFGLNSQIIKLNQNLKDAENKISKNDKEIFKLRGEDSRKKKIIEEKEKKLRTDSQEIFKLNTEKDLLNKRNILKEEENKDLNNQLNFLKEEKKKLKKLNDFTLKFENNDREGDYDIVININSIKNLTNEGWIVKYNKKNGKQNYSEKKDKETIIVGVVGNRNQGKSFFLKKLSNYDIPLGFNVKTEGLSIIYGKSQDLNIAILDSAGQETPLLEYKNNEKEENEINQENELEFEEYSRDKLVTELFIQKFILWKSNIIILVVGNITLSEQKLYSRIKNELQTEEDSTKKAKKLFVIHNLKTCINKKQVDDYIQNTLKKLYNLKLKENTYQNVGTNETNDEERFDKYFVEKNDQNIHHFIFVNDSCDCSKFYNKPVINFLSQAINIDSSRDKFSILEDCQEFLAKMSEEILENKLDKNNILIDNEDKLIIKEPKEIILKKFVIDEMGFTKNDGNTPKYSYYIDPKASKFYVNIELPGGGKIKPFVNSASGYYIFRFEGEQKGELSPEDDHQELEESQLNNLIMKKNMRKKHPIHIQFKISQQVIQLKFKDSATPIYKTIKIPKGISVYEFDIILMNSKKTEETNEYEEF